MNKKTIISILIAFVAVAGQGQVRCYVIGTVAEGTTPVELRIYREARVADKQSHFRLREPPVTKQ